MNSADYYYISELVRALWLVNLAGRTFLHGPLKFKVVSVAKLLRDLSPKILNYLAGKGLQLSFTLTCVLKRANDLKNDFKLTRFAFDPLQKFEAVPHG